MSFTCCSTSLQASPEAHLQAPQWYRLYRDHPQPCCCDKWLALQLPFEQLLHRWRHHGLLLLVVLLL